MTLSIHQAGYDEGYREALGDAKQKIFELYESQEADHMNQLEILDVLKSRVESLNVRRPLNTPIEELMDEYTRENCDFTDLEWVLDVSERYVRRMPDSQVRCLLHTLVSHVQQPAETRKPRVNHHGIMAFHDQACAVRHDVPESAVLDCNTAVFHPSWKAQADGWMLVRATGWRAWIMRKLNRA